MFKSHLVILMAVFFVAASTGIEKMKVVPKKEKCMLFC